LRVEILKGKTKIPETLEIDLAEAIEVKGMKAMGNRLSPHEVQEIELIHSPVEEEDDEVLPVGSEDAEVVTVHKAKAPSDSVVEDEEDIEIPDSEDIEPDEDPVINDISDTEAENAPEIIQEVQSESSKEPETRPSKKIDFEITNPDDLDIDDKGQLGLF